MYFYFISVTRWLVISFCLMIYSAQLFSGLNDAIHAINAKDKVVNLVHIFSPDYHVKALCRLAKAVQVCHLLGADDNNYTDCVWCDRSLFVPVSMFSVQHGKNGSTYIHSPIANILMSCSLEKPRQFVVPVVHTARDNMLQMIPFQPVIPQQFLIKPPTNFCANICANANNVGPAQSYVHGKPVVQAYWQQPTNAPPPLMGNQKGPLPLYLSPAEAMRPHLLTAASVQQLPPDQYLQHMGFPTAKNESKTELDHMNHQSMEQKIVELGEKVKELCHQNQTREAVQEKDQLLSQQKQIASIRRELEGHKSNSKLLLSKQEKDQLLSQQEQIESIKRELESHKSNSKLLLSKQEKDQLLYQQEQIASIKRELESHKALSQQEQTQQEQIASQIREAVAASNTTGDKDLVSFEEALTQKIALLREEMEHYKSNSELLSKQEKDQLLYQQEQIASIKRELESHKSNSKLLLSKQEKDQLLSQQEQISSIKRELESHKALSQQEQTQQEQIASLRRELESQKSNSESLFKQKQIVSLWEELQKSNSKILSQHEKIVSLKNELEELNSQRLSQQRQIESASNNRETQASKKNGVQQVAFINPEITCQETAVITDDKTEKSYYNETTNKPNDSNETLPLADDDTTERFEPPLEKYSFDQPAGVGLPTKDHDSMSEEIQHPITKTPETTKEQVSHVAIKNKKYKKRRHTKAVPKTVKAASKTVDLVRTLDESGDSSPHFGAVGLHLKETVLQYPRTVITSAMVTTLLLSCYCADVDLNSVFFYLVTVLNHFYETGMFYTDYTFQTGMALASEYLSHPSVAVFSTTISTTIGAYIVGTNGNCFKTREALAEHKRLHSSLITGINPTDYSYGICPEFNHLRQYGTVPCFDEVDWQTFQKPAPEGSHITLGQGEIDLKDASCKTLKKLDRLLKLIAHTKDTEYILKQCGVITNDSWAQWCYSEIVKKRSSNKLAHKYIQQLVKLQKKRANDKWQHRFHISARRIIGNRPNSSDVFYGAALCCQSQGECSIPPGVQQDFFKAMNEDNNGKIAFDLPHKENRVYALQQFRPSKHGGYWVELAQFSDKSTLEVTRAPKTGIYRVIDTKTDHIASAYCIINETTSSHFFQ